jgi:hypothetical protein
MEVRVLFALMTAVGIGIAALMMLWAATRLLRLGHSDRSKAEP